MVVTVTTIETKVILFKCNRFSSKVCLSLYQFVLVINDLTSYIEDKILWYMLFADDVVLVGETRAGTN